MRWNLVLCSLFYFTLVVNFQRLPASPFHPPLLNGVEAQARAQDKELCSGNDDVDLLLRGLGSRKPVQVSGDKGSGKSVRSPRCVG